MKKIIVPVKKEEECFIKELSINEIEEVEAGGAFPFIFWKRCPGFKIMLDIEQKSRNCKKYVI